MDNSKTPDIHPVRLWFGMFGSPIVWGGVFLLAWLLSELGCQIGLGEMQWFGINAVYVAVIFTIGLGLILTIAAGIISYRNLRFVNSFSSDESAANNRALERTRFFATAGILLSVTFGLLLVMMAIPVLVLPACDIY